MLDVTNIGISMKVHNVSQSNKGMEMIQSSLLKNVFYDLNQMAII